MVLRARIAVAVLLLTVVTAAAWAQTAPAAAPSPAPASGDPLGRTTPRGTVLGFLAAARKGDHHAAALYLNTSLRGTAAATLARQLFVVIDTRLPARLTQISEQADGSAGDGVHRYQESIGAIERDEGNLEIVLERVNRPRDGWIWLFSRKTLDAIPAVYQEVGRVSFEALLPAAVASTQVAGIRLFEWLALLLCLPALYLFLALVNRVLKPLFPNLFPLPVRLLLLAAVIRSMLAEFGLPILARQIWSSTSVVLTVAGVTWLLILLNGRTEPLIVRRIRTVDRAGAASIARVVRRGVDVLILMGAALVTLQHFGVDPAPALAGLGVGGIAVALAAQKTLENVVAGVSLIFDRAVRVGDVLTLKGVVGTVEYIGLRSTRMRTLDRTVVTVPNGQIATMTLEALSARDKFWFHPAVALDRQTTAAQLRLVLGDARRLLEEHDLVDRPSIRVRFQQLGLFSIDVDVFAYVIARDWEHFLEIQEQLLFALMEIVRRAGTAFAVPPALTSSTTGRPA